MKNTLMAFFVAGILVIFILLLDSPPQVFTRNTETTPSGLPQASSYMINSETRKYDERGRLHLILTTERGQFFEAKKQFAMDAPVVVALDRDSRKPPWRLTAKTGTVFNNGDHIVFQGDVHARQSEASGASELRTQKLDYFPDRDLVKSDRRVELTSPGHRIDAIGLKADLDRQVFELRCKVKGLHHVPD